MVYVSGSLWAAILCLGVGLLLALWPKRHGGVISDSRVSLKRRFAAFVIDMYVATMVVISFPIFVSLTTEAIATGSWAWSFERDYYRRTDIIGTLAFFAAFAGIYFYFAWHFGQQRQTLGQHLLSFKLIPATNKPRMAVRALVAWLVLAWWPVWPWTIFKRQQDYRWDTASGIVARRVERRER